jgi:hypothetical protein
MCEDCGIRKAVKYGLCLKCFEVAKADHVMEEQKDPDYRRTHE